MSRFRVGQRVRIRWDWPPDEPNLLSCHDFTGYEATVVEIMPLWCNQSEDADIQCYVLLIDGFDFEDGYHREDQIEPLTDANDLVSWGSMRDLWVPAHLRVRA